MFRIMLTSLRSRIILPARRCALAATAVVALWVNPASATERLDGLLQAGAPEQTEWAQRFEHGEGVARDYEAALVLYCHAAQAGHVDARYGLGWMYANGRGVPRDDALAAAWFKLAADQGDAQSARMLARLETPAENALCVKPDGSVYRRPVESRADPSKALIAQWVDRLAPEYGLDARLVLAVIRAESNFNPKALSPKNARGLMQLIPATAKRFGVEDVWDPVDNLRGGMAYLRWLLDHFDGRETLALAGYNAGEGAVRRHKGIPPYPETRAYVKRVAHFRRTTPAKILGAS